MYEETLEIRTETLIRKSPTPRHVSVKKFESVRDNLKHVSLKRIGTANPRHVLTQLAFRLLRIKLDYYNWTMDDYYSEHVAEARMSAYHSGYDDMGFANIRISKPVPRSLYPRPLWLKKYDETERDVFIDDDIPF